METLIFAGSSSEAVCSEKDVCIAGMPILGHGRNSPEQARDGQGTLLGIGGRTAKSRVGLVCAPLQL